MNPQTATPKMTTTRTIKKVLIRSAIGLVSLILLIFILLSIWMVYSMYKAPMESVPYEAKPPSYWPQETWERSTPEEQGMNSEKLLEMVDAYQTNWDKEKHGTIESITLIRNGYVVADIYLNPLYPPDTKHIIHSCTKSIMSILIGIAIEEGHIESVEVPILDILGQGKGRLTDERMAELTLQDVLSMQTGLHSRDSYVYQWEGLFDMMATDDWTQYILDLPFEVDPGTRYEYSNAASFLLSAVLTKATDTTSLAFAKEHLFDPLGIEEVKWETSPQGIYIGWARMWLKPHDMAKIGMLYLQKGRWDQQQIVPEVWVEESLVAHASPKQYRFVYREDYSIDYLVSGGLFASTNLARPFSDGYGYQWWLDKSGMYTAVGVGGQYITVAPQEQLIAVFTSKLRAEGSFLPPQLLKKYILPAIVSPTAIDPNPTAQQELLALASPPPLATEPVAVPDLPPIALEISGASYYLEDNPWEYDKFQLSFYQDSSFAEVHYTNQSADTIGYQIGLDELYRWTESGEDTYAAKGGWTAQDTFEISYERIGYSYRGKWILAFEEDRMAVEEQGVTGTYRYGGRR